MFMKDIPVIKLTNQGSTDELGRDFQNLVGPGPVRIFLMFFRYWSVDPWNNNLRAQIIFLPSFWGNTFSIPANNYAIIIIFFVTKYLSNIIFNFIAKLTIAYFAFKIAFKLKVLNFCYPERFSEIWVLKLGNSQNEAFPWMTEISLSLPSILNHFMCWTFTSWNYFKVTDPSVISIKNHKLS